MAVKLLKEEYADDTTFVERFGREARATAAWSTTISRRFSISVGMATGVRWYSLPRPPGEGTKSSTPAFCRSAAVG